MDPEVIARVSDVSVDYTTTDLRGDWIGKVFFTVETKRGRGRVIEKCRNGRVELEYMEKYNPGMLESLFGDDIDTLDRVLKGVESLIEWQFIPRGRPSGAHTCDIYEIENIKPRR